MTTASVAANRLTRHADQNGVRHAEASVLNPGSFQQGGQDFLRFEYVLRDFAGRATVPFVIGIDHPDCFGNFA